MVPAYTKNETLLRVTDLHLTRDKNKILEGINLEVKNIVRPNMQQGQVCGLLGPSGIGKTQLFRCLAGLQKPTSGTIQVTEKQLPVTAGMVGVVEQNYVLFNWRTVLDNLIIAARQHGHSKKESREQAYAMLDKFKLVEKANVYPQQLSGGQRQRIAIAKQLLCSNHFLLMDEPFSGLDPIMKDVVCHTITEVSELDELNTIIVTTHDIESAVAIADTLWLLGRERDAAGKVVSGAKVAEVYDLIEAELAWHPGIQETPKFSEFVRGVKQRFRTL